MSADIEQLKTDPKTALLVVDVQPDFYTDGGLGVQGGEEVVEPIVELARSFQTVVYSQDSHPEEHISFASSYKDIEPFTPMTLEAVENDEIQSEVFSKEQLASYLQKLGSKTQVLWPDHCVIGTKKWELDSRFELDRASLIIRKGYRKEADSHSPFYENDGESLGLGAMLRDRGIKRIVCVGLAGDYCVYWAVKDAIREGFQVVYDPHLTRYVDLEGSKDKAVEDMKARGVEFVDFGLC